MVPEESGSGKLVARTQSHSEEDVMKSANHCFKLVLSAGLLLASLTINGFAQDPSCTQLGGAILTNVGGFGQIDGGPTTMGVATGDLKGAIGIQIVGHSPDFTSITVQHHWVTENGETLNISQATLHGAFVAPGLLAVTKYNAHLVGGTGRFAKATGDTSYIGEIDFNNGHVVLRYSGTVCYGGSN
jgi:hypothetical protein